MKADAFSPDREWVVQARDGTGLFVRRWVPGDGAARGGVVITHGMGEHAGRYDHVARRLAAAGLRVHVWELRGHGRSGGARGDARDYETLLDDLAAVWEVARADAAGGPVFLYGHSMGGQIALNFAVRDAPDAAGLAITSPWLRLAFEPPRWKRALAGVAARVWPALAQDTDVGPEVLSRDLAFLQGMPDGRLVHQRMSARMYAGVTEGAVRGGGVGGGLEYPILLIHGTADGVTSAGATEEFFNALRSGDKRLMLVRGGLHETHNDLCREEVMEGVLGWVGERVGR